jgi:hypothetical protein
MPDLYRGILERMLPLELVPMHKELCLDTSQLIKGKGDRLHGVVD